MSIHPRFGPAGKPPRFKGPTIETPKFLHDEGLDALEYQCVRGVRISEADARKLGKIAKDYNVHLTLHGPYFINLCSASKEVISKSKERLIESLKAASFMGASQVVFHPGYYGNLTPEHALSLCIKAMKEVVEEAKSLKINVFLGPETTGKISQVGSLEEIIAMCEEVDLTRPTIDWAHIHARGCGAIKEKKDYYRIIDLIERRLGSDVVKNLHVHYTPVEFTSKGERRHRTMEEKDFGPDFRYFAEIIVEQNLSPTIISESPLLDIDSLKMKAIYQEVSKLV